MSIFYMKDCQENLSDYTTFLNEKLSDATITKIVLEENTTYVISSPLIISHSETCICSSKSSVIKLADNSYSTAYSLIVAEKTSGLVNISLENFTIDGNRENNINYYGTGGVLEKHESPFPTALVNLSFIDNLNLYNMTLKNAWNSCVWISDCQNFIIDKCKIYNYRLHGIALRNNSSYDGTTSSGIITNNIIDGGVVGIENIFGVKNLTIANNVVYNNKDSNRFPEWAYAGTYPNVYPLASGWKNPQDEGYVSPALMGDGAGIESTGSYTESGAGDTYMISITGNICNKNMCGIRVEEESHLITIASNMCSCNVSDGIYVFSAHNITITNNTTTENNCGIRFEKLDTGWHPYIAIVSNNMITKNISHGISMSKSKFININGNTFADNNTSNTDGCEVYIYSQSDALCTDFSIVNNQFINFNGRENNGIVSDQQLESGYIVSNNLFKNIANSISLPTTSSGLIINNLIM